MSGVAQQVGTSVSSCQHDVPGLCRYTDSAKATQIAVPPHASHVLAAHCAVRPQNVMY